VPLIEGLHLPQEIRAKANPKSSTGRLDVFTRVLTDRNNRFDEIAAGYRGNLYLEVVPRTFAIRVQTGLALNQVRLMSSDARLDDRELRELHREVPLLYRDSRPLAAEELSLADGLFLSLDVSGSEQSIVGYRAKKNSLPIDLTRVGALEWQDYWEPVHPERGGRIVLEPEVFYLLLSAEGVSIPPSYAATAPRTAAGRRSRCARATSPSWSSTASRYASSRSSGWPASPTCCTARTSGPTTRARRRC
jgi:dCTP deaminase